MNAAPLMRLFAGPNGSGKTTLIRAMQFDLHGAYINADDIERTLNTDGFLSLEKYGITATESELRAFLLASLFSSPPVSPTSPTSRASKDPGWRLDPR